MALTSNAVTAEDAAQYDGEDAAPVLAVAGDRVTLLGNALFVTGVNGVVIPVAAEQWVVRYAPGDCGVMDPKEYERWFGPR